MKRLYLLLLGVFVLFISLTSVSYAYTYDDLLTYLQQCAEVELNTTAGYKTGFYYQYQTLLNKDTAVRNLLNQHYSNANYFILSNTYNGGTRFDTRILCYSVSPTGFSHSTSKLSGHNDTWAYINVTGGTYLGQVTIWNNSVSYSSSNETRFYSNYDSQSPKALFLIGDVDTSGGGFTGYNINGLILPPQFTFIPYTNETIHVTLSNNLSGECIRLPFSPAENYKRVGNIQNWDDLDGFSMYWSPILYVSGDETYSDVVSMYTYTKQNGGLSDGHMTFMNINDGSVYINVDKLYNKQTYVLSISGHIGDDYFPIYLDGHDYDATFYSYFYTTDTSVPSNNTGISQQYYESLPPSLQNFLEDNSTNFNDTQQNNINYLLNDMFTDVFSGDQFGGNLALEMGYSGDILDSNYYSNLIYDFYTKIINTIASDNTTSSITFNIRSKTFVLNSSDFLVPNGPLKTFVTTFLIAGIVYLFSLQIHRIVLSIATLDLYSTIKSFDQKHSVFM